MAFPLLQSKLFFPPTRPALVQRPRLLDRLNEGLHRRMTLISAPAGFGKTTLISAWLASIDRPAAWLSLDEGDSDPTRFLTYFLAALRTIAPAMGEGLIGALQAPPPLHTDAILTALLNEISAMPEPIALVLDDYHAIESPPVDKALTFLLEHLPPPMHLIITTREDPPLPLPRLRARGHLTELRAADLRFTAAEAADFLHQVMGLELSAEDVSALDARTEGWVAGLQLAALSMQGHQDVPGFIRAFAGDHRYIVDYLVEEVLQRQPAPLRDFLLQTAILERLSGPLCDAVTGQTGGGERLELLERGNFFVVPLDDRRHWYRYHHLFADVLHARLMAEQPAMIATLHGRASDWYEQHGAAADAIRHALAARDFERSAELAEREWPAIRRNRQEATMLGWLTALPGEILQRRPVLNAAYAHLLLAVGQFEAVESRLQEAEQWLDREPHPHERRQATGTKSRLESPHPAEDRARREMVVVDEEAFRTLPGMIAVARTGLSMARGDVPGAVRHAQQALDLASDDDDTTRGAAAAFLGLVAWTNGELEAGHRRFAEGMASLQRAGYLSDAVGGSIALADMRKAQGRLREAMRTYERGLELASAQGGPVLRGTADMHVGLSEIFRERNDLDTATQHLGRSRELGDLTGFPQNPYRWRVAMARVREAQGALDEALDLLNEAESLYLSEFFPNVRPVPALRVRVWIAQGRLAEALDWAREQGLSAEDDLSYLREFEHITLARILLARFRHDRDHRSIQEAITLLERLRKAAEDGERAGSLMEILVVQALAHHARGDSPAALAPLKRALILAEPEGYVRLFADEGPPMAVLLEEAAHAGIAPSYARRILAAIQGTEERAPVAHPLIEPLSDRELDVLRLLATDLTGPEIARELMISLSTTRTHTSNIYGKLGVTSRRAAVRRAEELALL